MLKLFRKRAGSSSSGELRTKASASPTDEEQAELTIAVNQLKVAVESNNTQLVKKLVSSCPISPSISFDDVGQTCLHLAASIGNLECVEIMAKSVDINIADAAGITPLHSAACHPTILAFLLKKKSIDANRLAVNRQSLLHMLAKKVTPIDESLWALLRKRGVMAHIPNLAGDTPLHVACQTGHQTLVDLLLTLPSVNINLQNKKDETPLHIAAMRDHLVIVKSLLTASASLHFMDAEGHTPLEVAASTDVEMAIREAIKIAKVSASGRESPVHVRPMQMHKQTSMSNLGSYKLSSSSSGISPSPQRPHTPRDNPQEPSLSSSAPNSSFLASQMQSFVQASNRLIIMDEEWASNQNLDTGSYTSYSLTQSRINSLSDQLESELVEELGHLLDESLILDALSKITSSKSFKWDEDFNKNKIEVLKWMSEFVNEEDRQSFLMHLKTKYPEAVKLAVIRSPTSSKKLSKKEKSQKRLTLVERKIKSFDWELLPEQLAFCEMIGTGSYGTVYRGILTSNGADVAIKQLTEDVGPDDTTTFMKEIAILSRLSHPHIIGFVGACIGSNFALVMEYCSQGNLKTFLKGQHTSWRLKIRLSRQISQGIEYLHEQVPPIVHRDLKCQNILVSSEGDAKVSDFGLSKTMSKTTTNGSKMGTLNWLAPEVLRGESHHTTAADVYAFGMVLFEILMDGKPPYDSWQPLQIVRAIDEGTPPEIPATCDAAYKALIQDCWDSVPEKRPPFAEISIRLKNMERALKTNAALSHSSSETSSPSASPPRTGSQPSLYRPKRMEERSGSLGTVSSERSPSSPTKIKLKKLSSSFSHDVTPP